MNMITKEAELRKIFPIAASAAALAAFVSGFAAGQHAAPIGDRLVEQNLLATIDLGKTIGVNDRELRLSQAMVAPGGHIGLHSHEDDPTVVYVLSGLLANHHEDGTTEELRAGQAFAEFGTKSHWVENKGTAPASFVFVSVSRRR
jgi:quercetin dioxygenase-like cupin family protein